MSLGFNTALTALTAARVALETIGHNIANANTSGYSRQRVLLSAYLPQSLRPGLTVGSGVAINAVDQIYDPLIVSRLRAQAHAVGLAGAQVDVYRDIEAALGEPSSSGLNARFGDFFGALGQLQAQPSDSSSRTAALQSAVSLAQSFRTIRSDLSSAASTADQAIDYEVDKVNKLLEDLADLNRSIVTNGFGGALPPDLRDRQDQILSELSQSIDVRVTRHATGQISVTSGGHNLVDPNGVRPVRSLPRPITGEAVRLRSGNSTADYEPKSGRLAALLEIAPQVAADGIQAIDDLAHAFIRDINHAHATGIPPSGGYTSVVGIHALRSAVAGGNVLNQKLEDVGLPFEMKDGLLTVSVTDQAGKTTQTRVAVLPSQMTVQDLLTAINLVPHVTASLDTTGQIRIASDAGYSFDFSSRLNPTPDAAGTFGGAQPTIVAALQFPASIPPGTAFQVVVDGGAPQTVTFQASHFANPATATAQEIAAAMNAQLTGAHASVVAGRLVLQGNTAGPSGSLQLNGGAVVNGQATPVKVEVLGSYGGSQDETYFLTAAANGVIGQTPNLQVEVRDRSGKLVGKLDVGLGYTPGTPLALKDGIQVALGPGAVSQSAGQFVAIDAIADGDQSGLLVAAGVNALFAGHDASTIGVRPELLEHQGLLATGLGGGVSDGSNLARLIATKDRKNPLLGDRTFSERFDRLVQDTGSSVQRAQSTLETQQLLIEQLEARRQATSGVNIDEELLQMEAFQRSYEIAARYTQTLSEVNQVLMDLAR